ncbi:MAG TPA: hypothetical protein VHH55_01345 [Gaiellaceae bacterium]|jgi:hypothetical protein|nr:hypothetical protein [Gaiellaceae bacterium]
MQTPEAYPPETYETEEPADRFSPDAAWLWGAGERLTWLSGLVLSLSTLMGWYVYTSGDLTLAVIGWHTGTLAKLVLLIGLAVVALHLLHAAGIELPATVPESLVVIVLGSLATIFVLIRLISIPDDFQPASRGVGIWISLIAALAVIVAGLLRASEEL